MIQKHSKSWLQQDILTWIKIGNHLDGQWKKIGKTMRLSGERRSGLKREEKVARAIGRMTQTVGNGIRLGGQIISPAGRKNETDSKETFYVIDRAIRLSEKRDIEKNAEKIRKPEREMKIRKKGRMQREVKKKQKTQAIRERKLAYVMEVKLWAKPG